jgi:hypothetical protein
MKHTLFYLLVAFSVISCKSQKQTFQPMADSIKNYFSKNVSDLKSVDTIYLMIDTVTQRLETIFQSAEYSYAATMARKMNNPDSTLLKDTANWLLSQTNALNNSKFLFYRAMPLVIYTKTDNQKGMAEQWLFFDKNFNLIPKYSFVKKVSNFDNNDLRLEELINFTKEEQQDFERKGILKYYWPK